MLIVADIIDTVVFHSRVNDLPLPTIQMQNWRVKRNLWLWLDDRRRDLERKKMRDFYQGDIVADISDQGYWDENIPYQFYSQLSSFVFCSGGLLFVYLFFFPSFFHWQQLLLWNLQLLSWFLLSLSTQVMYGDLICAHRLHKQGRTNVARVSRKV